jgi:UV DNA damage repair endonuclease
MHMTDYNKLDALKYLASTKLDNINEWTESFMYTILSKVILEDDSKTYTKEELDRFIETASNA